MGRAAFLVRIAALLESDETRAAALVLDGSRGMPTMSDTWLATRSWRDRGPSGWVAESRCAALRHVAGALFTPARSVRWTTELAEAASALGALEIAACESKTGGFSDRSTVAEPAP